MKHLIAGLALGLAGLGAHADGSKLASITIDHPYARATLAGQSNGAAYFSLDNRGAGDRLLAVSAPVSARAELHSMTMDGGVMRMRQLDAIDVPAGKTVELKPGGLHVMLLGLKAPLKAGDSFLMTLKFEKAGEATVDVKVQAVGAAPMPHDMKH
ncbi:copper chaperone PCu(A)C [Piscinibacter sp.]|jgi:copper(I)-binding protein|uniref:copper chaperone PCu(A)C n=1 Tax=Piscinibacter sp. TaxID=1903157 RepID=UPI00355A6D1A